MQTALTSENLLEISALVKQQRQGKDLLGDLLNDDKQRAELVQMMESFYHRQGIYDITPDMIEAGVAEYERQRLSYKGIQGGWLARVLADAYVGFFRMRLSFALGAVFLLSLGFVANFLSSAYDEFILKGMADDRYALIETNKSLHEAFRSLIAEHEKWKAIPRHSEVSPQLLNRALDEHEKALSAARQQFEANHPARTAMLDKLEPPMEASSKGDYDKAIGKLSALIDADKRAYASARDALASKSRWVDNFLSLEADIATLEREGADVDLFKTYLVAGDLPKAKESVNEARLKLVNDKLIKTLNARYKVLESQGGGVFMDSDGRMRFQEMLAEAKAAANKPSEKDFSRISASIESLISHVQRELILRVVDAPQIKSGVQRTNDDIANAKRHYIVIEAVDSTGARHERLVYSQETKRSEIVSYWGQEVDASTYEAVKQDKIQDGIVDDRIFGSKASGRYSLEFNRPVKAGSITRW